MENSIQTLIVVIQILMAIISLVGGAMLMALQSAIKELRDADKQLAADMKSYAKAEELERWRSEQREEVRSMRQEQRERFERIFDKLDDIQEKLSNKADRS